MATTNEFNNIKSELILYLQDYNLTPSKINGILSDNFIYGIMELRQQEPVGDKFLALIRDFSSEENLLNSEHVKRELQNQLNYENYFSEVVQYALDSLKNVDISHSLITTLTNENPVVNSENVKKARIGVGLGLFIVKASAAVKTIAGQLGTYGQIAVRTYEQDQKVWNAVDSITAEIERIAYGNWETGKDAKSPLVIDLDGDGVETTTTGNGVHFDHDGNGFAEKSGWVGKDDGLLVRDVNQNGQIDDGTELFGNNSVLSSGEKAA